MYIEFVIGDKKTTIAIAQGAGAYWNDSDLRSSGIVKSETQAGSAPVSCLLVGAGPSSGILRFLRNFCKLNEKCKYYFKLWIQNKYSRVQYN